MSDTNFAHRACGQWIIMFTNINNHMCSFALAWSQSHALGDQMSLALVSLTKYRADILCVKMNNAFSIAQCVLCASEFVTNDLHAFDITFK